MNLLNALRYRASLYRAQVHNGSNIFDQALSEIERLQRANKKLQTELATTVGLIEMFGAIEVDEPDLTETIDVTSTEHRFS